MFPKSTKLIVGYPAVNGAKRKIQAMNATLYDDVAVTPARQLPVIRGYGLWGKRVFDVLIVLAMLPIAVPIIGLVWAMTALDGGGGFFTQERVGRGGGIFRCWKIRTMVRDADNRLLQLIAQDEAIAQEWQFTQKLHHDPRITRLGQLLRKTSIDELPQLWNVLVGDMSLIGPRPFTPQQQPLYDQLPSAEAYYALRPGISGLWQVACRNDGGFDERARYDHAYAEGLTFWQDLRIIGRTVQVVCHATGK